MGLSINYRRGIITSVLASFSVGIIMLLLGYYELQKLESDLRDKGWSLVDAARINGRSDYIAFFFKKDESLSQGNISAGSFMVIAGTKKPDSLATAVLSGSMDCTKKGRFSLSVEDQPKENPFPNALYVNDVSLFDALPIAYSSFPARLEMAFCPQSK